MSVYLMSILSLAGCSGFEQTMTQSSSAAAGDALEFTEEEKELLPFMDNDFTFAEAEARKHAMDIAASFDQSDGQKRTIDRLLTINLPMLTDTTQKGFPKRDSTPEMYIYDFKPNGFAVICADERYLGSIISSPVSSFTHDLHPGYQLVFEGALADLTHRREEFYRKKDSVVRMVAFKRLGLKIRHYVKAQKNKKEPLLSRWMRQLPNILGWIGTPAYARPADKLYPDENGNLISRYMPRLVSKWRISEMYDTNVLLRTNFHQGAPYNNKMGDIERLFGAKCSSIPYGANAKAGCGPIAYLQLLLYYYPTNKVLQQDSGLKRLYNYHYTRTDTTYANTTYKNTTLDDVASSWIKKIYDEYFWIGSGKHCGGTYIIDIGSSNIIKHSYGFFVGNFRSFDGDQVQQSINAKKPVLVNGFSNTIIFGIPNPGSGHIWLIDGTRYHHESYLYNYAHLELVLEDTEEVLWNKSQKLVEVERTYSSSSWTKTLINNELHHNFGWGNAKGEQDLQSYRLSDWVRIGTFGRSRGKNYDISTSVITNITPL